MRRIGVVAALAAAGLALAACSSGNSGNSGTSGTSATGAKAGQVEVFTWWASGSEKLGLDAMVGVFNKQHPEIKFINGAVAGGAGSAAKDLLQTRLQAKNPPDTFQAHAGKEIADYIAAGQLQDVSNLYDEFGLRNAFPPDLLKLLTVGGKIYSVPSDIHRANMVWANPAVLTAAGLDPKATYATMADWFKALDKVKAAGKTALSVAAPWTQVQLLENALLADLGAAKYTGLFSGTTDWKGSDVTAAIADYAKLLSYTNTDRDGLDWPDATQQVIDGKAAFNVMGDWAAAAFVEQKKVAGTDYIYFPTPGTVGVFDFLADSFTLPVGAPNPAGAKAWLQTVGSADGQLAFNKIKGSIPARSDAKPSDYSEYQQTAIKSFGQDTIVPSLAHGAATPIAVLTAISDAVGKFGTGSSNAATFQTELAAAAGLAAGK
jgi:glucose/mannose transport system substrate-binding protein